MQTLGIYIIEIERPHNAREDHEHNIEKILGSLNIIEKRGVWVSEDQRDLMLFHLIGDVDNIESRYNDHEQECISNRCEHVRAADIMADTLYSFDV